MMVAAPTSIDGIRRRLEMASDDRRRVEIIEGFLPGLSYHDPDQALGLADELLALADGCGNRSAVAAAHRYKGEALLRRHLPAEASLELRTAFATLQTLLLDSRTDALRSAVSSVAATLGDVSAADDSPADALRWYLTALDSAPPGDISAHVRAHEALGHLFAGLGDYARALEHQFACLSTLESSGSRDEIGVVLASIGTSYAMWGDAAQANTHLSRALELFRISGNRLLEVQTLINLSALLADEGKLDEALELALTAGTIYEALGDRKHAAASLVTVGNIYERQGDLDGALHCYVRALHAVETGDDYLLHANVLHCLGNLYRITGSRNEAQYVYEQALGIIQDLEEPRLESVLHESLAQVDEELNLAAQALEHLKQFARLRDQLASMDRQQAIAELQIRFDLESMERERELFRVRAEQLEAEMARKQSELTSLALNLVQKNELLDALGEQVAALKADAANGEHAVERILSEIETKRDPGGDWEVLEKQIQARNPELVQRLLERCPTLTKGELKVCCLTSINLPTKDIATLLFTSTRTVETHRLNIRRKLDLPARSNLSAFLSSI